MFATTATDANDSASSGALPILYFHPDARAWVVRWAGRFQFQECRELPADARVPLLWATPDHLELRVGSARDKGAWVDESEVRRRIRQTPELVRACGIRSGMRVLDAMAGWGLDGLVLAAAGARVTMVEREPLVQALQEDLVRRMEIGDVESLRGDGFLLLEDRSGFDVVYLDPMFPERGKQALPGKRMQYLAALIGAYGATEEGASERPLEVWIARAIQVARHRVVVKRRLRDHASLAPDWQIRGRSIRYDVYRGRGVNAPAARPDENPGR